MNSSQRVTRPAGAAVRADLSGREPASTLAGLIDVLGRTDGALPRQRTRPVVHRSGARPVPLRSVQPAPSARAARRPVEAPLTSRVVVVPERVRQPLGGLRGVARRMALWGAGDQGEYLAWRTPAAPAPVRGRRRAALRAFGHRMALWGAGDQGQHLAWSSSPSPAPTRPVLRGIDPPAVLRELPSTPSNQPVASSPAAALLSAGPASSPGSRTGTAAADATARPTPHPSATEPPDRSQLRVGRRPPRDWPSSGRYGARSRPPFLPVRTSGQTSRTSGMPAPRSPRGSGGAGARGDPSGCPVRGSPLPFRRAGPVNGFPTSPFPPRAPSSLPRPAPRAPS